MAQEVDRIAPKPVPRQAEPSVLPDDPLPAPDGDDTVIIKRLKGLAFVPSIQAVKNPPPRLEGLDTGNIALLQRPAFASIPERYLGQPVSLRSIHALVREVVLYYRDQDHPIVDVIVPEQEIGSGVLQIVVVEGRAGEIRAEGNRWFSSESLTRQVRIAKGSSIRTSGLLADVNWINNNPFRRADLVFTPGSEPATTDIILKVKDRFPVRFYAGYEDSGNELTGLDRYLTGFNWGNAFGLDHQFSYQFTTSGDLFSGDSSSDGLRAHSFSYLVPLPWRHSFAVMGSYAESEAVTLPLNLAGSGTQLSARYSVPLPDLGKHVRHEAYAGFDWKQSDNDLEFGFVPAASSLTDVAQWIFGYRALVTDPWGSWNLAPELVWSPGGMLDHQTDADYRASRPGSSAPYVYAKMEIARSTRLPWDFTLWNQFNWQVANNNLLGSEQLPVGGYNSVRGYDERQLNNTDEGWISRNELRTPSYSVLRLFGVESVEDQLQFLFFFDYASVRAYRGKLNRPDGMAVDSETLASVGPGIRYVLGPWASVRADYGFQLRDVGNVRHDGRWHLGVVFSY